MQKASNQVSQLNPPVSIYRWQHWLHAHALQGQEAAKVRVIASAMCALLLADRGRCLAASNVSSQNRHEHPGQPAAGSSTAAGGLTDSKATHPQDSIGCEDVWAQVAAHAQAAVQAYIQRPAKNNSLPSAKDGGLLSGLLCVTDLMTELLFLMGLHGKVQI